MAFFSRKYFWLGLFLVLLYVYSVRPIGLSRQYSEDLCYPEMTRQLMAQEMSDSGGVPKFTTDRFMAPEGASVPYMSWQIERDWLGSLFWKWDRDFPFFWAYFGFSLIITYLGIGFILFKMGLSPRAASFLACFVVVAHIPRHFKIWHHYEHLLQHWVYWGFFLDAWIWKIFWRENKWDWKLELWRGVALIGTLWTVGTFYGPVILEWSVVHLCIFGVYFSRKQKGFSTQIKSFASQWRSVFIPLTLISVMLWVDWQWFLPLYTEVKKLGTVSQDLGWLTHLGYWLRPLWLEPLFKVKLSAIDRPETVVSVGWMYLIPAFLAIKVSRKKQLGSGIGALLPFLILIGIALIYSTVRPIFGFQWFIQKTVPFMSFFRVASRWGLFMPQLLTILIVLAWPELLIFLNRINSKKRKIAIFIFGFLSLVELSWLAHPVNMSPPLSDATQHILDGIRNLPGSTVLDLPFCVAGGNGICSAKQCPNYPGAVLSQCLRTWHDKKVYGLYQSRIVPAHCENYDRAPFLSWFDAWDKQRCFTNVEWKDFCSYLKKHSEISAILLYTGIWKGAGTPECLEKFRKHLGSPVENSSIMTAPTRGGKGKNPSELFWFKNQCQTK